MAILEPLESNWRVYGRKKDWRKLGSWCFIGYRRFALQQNW
jgi:hypothetical protein